MSSGKIQKWLKGGKIIVVRKKVLLFDINGTILKFPNIARSYRKKDPKLPDSPSNRIPGLSYDQQQFINERKNEMALGRFNKFNYDFSEWSSIDTIREQINRGEFIQAGIDLLQYYKGLGYELKWLSGRGAENVGADYIENEINIALEQKLGFPVTGHAIYSRDTANDGAPEKKQRAFKQYQAEYDDVVFLDDNEDNLDLARNVLGAGNVIDVKMPGR